MKFLSILKKISSLLTITQSTIISPVSSELSPEKLEISAAFPPDNQFGIVFNGQSNKILLKIVNLGQDPIEDVMRIHQVWSEFREIGGKERVLKRGAPTPSKRTLEPKFEPYIIPYLFHAEEREGNIGLRIWVEWSGPKGKKFKTQAYDSTVSIQEPPTRWFDPQLLLLYVILGSTFGGIGYMLYTSYVPATKSTRTLKLKRSTESSVSTSSKIATPTGGAYEEEWIPAGHSAKLGSKKLGNESGGEVSSGAEGKPRRRKR